MSDKVDGFLVQEFLIKRRIATKIDNFDKRQKRLKKANGDLSMILFRRSLNRNNVTLDLVFFCRRIQLYSLGCNPDVKRDCLNDFLHFIKSERAQKRSTYLISKCFMHELDLCRYRYHYQLVRRYVAWC